MIDSTKRRLAHKLLPSPVTARHVEYSLVLSQDDDPFHPSERLLDIALSAAGAAREIKLADVAKRSDEAQVWASLWPGEHYRLLAGLVEVLHPRMVIEIGTYTGLSALALKDRLAPDGLVITFDIVPWDEFANTALTPTDVSDGRLRQVVDDLSDPQIVERHHDLLRKSELIFVDAAKDGVMESRLLRNLESIEFTRQPIVVFDDIRLWNMLAVWREISRPKLDITSLGHWSGTGLVDWVG